MYSTCYCCCYFFFSFVIGYASLRLRFFSKYLRHFVFFSIEMCECIYDSYYFYFVSRMRLLLFFFNELVDLMRVIALIVKKRYNNNIDMYSMKIIGKLHTERKKNYNSGLHGHFKTVADQHIK